MNPFYKIAIKVALERIDRNPDTFRTKKAQLQMLRELIQINDLKVTEKCTRGRLHLQTIDLTAERYREIMEFFAVYHCDSEQSRAYKITQLFVKGSAVVQIDALEIIGLRGKSGADSDMDNEEDHEKSEDGMPSNNTSKRSIANAASPLNKKQTNKGAAAIAARKRKADDDLESAARKRLKSPAVPSASGIQHETASKSSEAGATGRQSNGGSIAGPSKKRKADNSLEIENRKRLKTPPATLGSGPEVRDGAGPPRSDAAAAKPSSNQDSTILTGSKRKAEDIIDGEEGRKRTKGTAAVSKDEPQDSTVPPSNATAAPTRSLRQPVLIEPHRLAVISRRDIGSEIDIIWSQAQSISRNIVKGTGVDLEKQADFVGSPSPELEELYITLFGPDWKATEAQLRQHGMTPNTGSLVEGCICAAVFKLVWNRALPWPGPLDTMEKLKDQEELINRVLAGSGVRELIRTLVWQDARSQFSDEDFQKREIAPISADLARTFMSTIEQQVVAFGATGHHEYQEQHAKQMADLFTRALVLKGMMATSPSYFTVEWISNGTDFNKDTMVELCHEEGPRTVTWCVSPLIKAKHTKGGLQQVMCRAKVFSAPDLG